MIFLLSFIIGIESALLWKIAKIIKTNPYEMTNSEKVYQIEDVLYIEHDNYGK